MRSSGPAAPCTPASTSSATNSSNDSETLFAHDSQVQVEATWGIYQCMITAYRQPDQARGREQMVQLIDAVSHSVPKHRPN